VFKVSCAVKILATVVFVAATAMVAQAQTVRDLLERETQQKAKASGPPALQEFPSLGEGAEEMLEEEAVIEQPGTVPVDRPALDKVVDPEEYIVGPGDDIVVYLWGEINFLHTLTITPEGDLIIPSVGVVHVAGLSLADTKRAIINAAHESYPGVEITASLSNLRVFRVFVTGEVTRPGTYLAAAVDRVSDVIARAGGLKKGGGRDISASRPRQGLEQRVSASVQGSERRIEVRRQGGQTFYADLQRFALDGDVGYNPYVNIGDIIYVPPKKENIWIYGEVSRPGTYELAPGDDLVTLVNLAGGLTAAAYTLEAEVVRFHQDGESIERIPMNLGDYLAAGDAAPSEPMAALQSDFGELPIVRARPEKRFPLRLDDRVYVRQKPGWHLKSDVTVAGAVYYPGTYAIGDSTRLKDVIAMGGGFLPEASLAEARIFRRTQTELRDPEFERLKLMVAADMTEEERQYFRTRWRHRPGLMTTDFQKLFAEGEESQNTLLEWGDVIRIPEKRVSIEITGQVENPGLVPYLAGRTFREYIEVAGGYARKANRGGARIIKRDSGQWLKARDDDIIGPGDSIFVPEKRDLKFWESTQSLITTLAEAATVLIVVRQATQ
jgi:protein involved in polysaccharide export with SLBB domain